MNLRYIKEVVSLRYEAGKCTGCRRCVEVCPHAVFSMNGKRAVLQDRDACMECGACQLNCSAGAIEVQAGVGCAAAVIGGKIRGGEPTCGCGDSPSCCS